MALGLGALPQPSPCWTLQCAAAGPSRRQVLAVHWAQEFGRLETYHGHVWDTVATFFQCVVVNTSNDTSNGTSMPPLKLLVPSHHTEHQQDGDADRFPMFQVVAALFSGPFAGLSIERHAWVPTCHGPDEEALRHGRYTGPCCLNGTAAAQLSATHGATSVAQLEFRHTVPRRQAALGYEKEAWTWRRSADGARRQSEGDFWRSMRRVVWGNLALLHATPDTALFASSVGGSNGRRIKGEPAVGAALGRYFGAARPGWRFRHVALHELSLADASWPSWHAMYSGVVPFSLARFIAAPCFSSS